MPNRMMQWFTYHHLPEYLQWVSKPCCDLAKEMDGSFPDSAEKTAGLRKLLEAKDCFVRMAIEAKEVSDKIIPPDKKI